MTKKGTAKKKQKDKGNKFTEPSSAGMLNICSNVSCRLRKAGCRGFEGCPGYKARG